MARKGKDNEGEISDVEFENIPGTDDYIEFLGEVDDEFGHLPRTDDYVDQLGEVHDISQVDDIGGIEAIQLNHHDGHDSDSDDDSGRSVYNPGLMTEKVIEEGTPAEFMHNANPTTNFPIPNEKEIRMSGAATSSCQDGSRKIDFTSPSNAEPPLAVNPPGLRWKGQPSISSSQLRLQSHQIMSRRKANSSK